MIKLYALKVRVHLIVCEEAVGETVIALELLNIYYDYRR